MKTKRKTQKVKEGTSKKRPVALERGPAGALGRVGAQGGRRFPAVLAVSLLYERPAY